MAQGSVLPKKGAADGEYTDKEGRVMYTIKDGGYMNKQGKKYFTIMWRDQNDKQYKKRVYTTRRKDAENELTAVMNEVNQGTFQKVEEIKFKDFSTKWLKLKKSTVKDRTYISYEGHINNYLNPKFGNLYLKNISTEMLDNYVAELVKDGTVSPKTIGNIVITLKGMLKQAVIWKYLRENPAIYTRKPRVEHKEMEYLNLNQFLALLEHVDEYYYPLFLTAGLTGLRRGELLAITWDDVSFRNKSIRINKGLWRGKLVPTKTATSIRTIYIESDITDALKKHQAWQSTADWEAGANPDNLVFTTKQGNPIDGDNLVKRVYNPALKLTELPVIPFHSLRHSAATLMIAAGAGPKDIQSQLGHSSIKITMDRYGHLMESSQRDAASRLQNLLDSHKADKVRVES